MLGASSPEFLHWSQCGVPTDVGTEGLETFCSARSQQVAIEPNKLLDHLLVILTSMAKLIINLEKFGILYGAAQFFGKILASIDLLLSSIASWHATEA